MSSGTDKTSTAVLAVDTGGTFTDLLLLADGVLSTLKVPSTPADRKMASTLDSPVMGEPMVTSSGLAHCLTGLWEDTQ